MRHLLGLQPIHWLTHRHFKMTREDVGTLWICATRRTGEGHVIFTPASDPSRNLFVRPGQMQAITELDDEAAIVNYLS